MNKARPLADLLIGITITIAIFFSGLSIYSAYVANKVEDDLEEHTLIHNQRMDYIENTIVEMQREQFELLNRMDGRLDRIEEVLEAKQDSQ